MKKRNDLGGATLWIFLIILGVAIRVGYIIGKYYFDDKTIQNEVAIIGSDTLVAKRDDAKEKVIRILDNYGATYESNQISSQINERGDHITISVEYQRTANLLVAKIPLHFRFEVQKEAAKAVGIVNQFQQSVEDSSNNAARNYQKALQGSGVTAPPSE